MKQKPEQNLERRIKELVELIHKTTDLIEESLLEDLKEIEKYKNQN